MKGRAILLYPEGMDPETVDAVAGKIETRYGGCERTVYGMPVALQSDDRIFSLLDDGRFKRWIGHVRGEGARVAILPTGENPLACRAYGIPESLDAALELAFDEEAETLPYAPFVDSKPFFGELVFGKIRWLSGKHFFGWIVHFFRLAFGLRFFRLRIETAKGQSLDTAVLTAAVASESLMRRSHPAFFDPSEKRCGRCAGIFYAPPSIVSAIGLKLRGFFSRSSTRLPAGVGTIQSPALTLSCPDGAVEVRVDGERQYAQELRIECRKLSVRIVAGGEPCGTFEEKESLRVQHLPVDADSIAFFTKRPLPLVKVALESAFAELFTTLRESARIDAAYGVLLVISVAMATTGLFQDSSPTIIGAMILAPLMAPIVALAMGVIRFDGSLVLRSLETIGISVVVALGISALFAWAMPYVHMTAQMAGRTHPTLLDLLVAILAGAAAAYGYADSRVGKSLAGVAIAVALVPPLSVAGIGLGWGEWAMFSGAFLLFLTNIVGIVLAAGTVFYLLGFSSWKYARSAFLLKVAMVLLLTVPLYVSTRLFVRSEQVAQDLAAVHTLPLPGGGEAGVELRGVRRKGDRIVADVLLRVPVGTATEQKESLIRRLGRIVGGKADLAVEFAYRSR
ncbi:TIGR00341 family protein [Nitratifractor sp.]